MISKFRKDLNCMLNQEFDSCTAGEGSETYCTKKYEIVGFNRSS